MNSMYFSPEALEKIDSCVFDQEAQTITVIRRMQSIGILAVNPPRPSPDDVWRDIYGIVDGKLVLISTEKGRHVPAHFVAESITFDE